MKKYLKSIISFGIIIVFVIVIEILNAIDVKNSVASDYTPEKEASIHLYGETHGVKEFYDKEFEIWKGYYKDGNRDLFVELPYYTAEFLNVWMQETDDEILNQIYEDIEGTASYTESYLQFLKRIKEECPETIFYGTDVGHQYQTTGARYLEYLEREGLEGSEQYKLASICIEQGEQYQGKSATDPYREGKMVDNFCATYERIGKIEVVGIYGSYHTDPTNPDIMAGKIKAKYGDIIESKFVINMLDINSNKHFSLGIGYVGIVFLLMLFIPNVIWTKYQPIGYELYVKNENKTLGLLEKIGEVGATILLPAFTDYNFKSKELGSSGFYFSYLDIYIIVVFGLMILYELYWIRYFRSEHTMNDFYRGIVGIPLAGATIPVIGLLLLGVSARSIALILVSIVLGIGHIGIHYMHYIEIQSSDR